MRVIGAEGMTPEELLAELEAGGRLAVFATVLSLIAISQWQTTAPHLVRPGERGPGLRYAVRNALLGWWCIPWGFLWTPLALLDNLRGGQDVTAGAMVLLREAARAASTDTPPPDYEAPAAPVLADLLAAGDLEGARRLVRTTDPEMLDPQAVRALAERLHRAGDHAGALEAFAVLIEGWPAFTWNGNVAYQVRACERALGRPTSLVPPPRPWQTPRGLLVLATSLLGLVGLAQWGVNEHLRANTRLWVVNGTEREVEVLLPGAAPVRLSPGALRHVHVAEGGLVAQVRRGDGSVDAVPLEVRASYLDRFARPTFVFNVDRAGALLLEFAVYFRRTEPKRPPPPRVVVGGPLLVLHVDHPFGPFPRSRGADGVASRLELLRGTPREVVGQFPVTALAEAREFLERRLERRPDDADTLDLYLELAHDDQARLGTFLRAGLDRRPVEVAWHRAYQDLHRTAEEEDALREEYRQRSAAAPDDAALVALHAWTLPDPREALARFDRALALDRGCPEALFGRARTLFVLGDWAGARGAVDRARARGVAGERVEELARELAAAQGEGERLVAALEPVARERPTDVGVWLRLAEAHALARRPERIEPATARLRAALRALDDPRAAAWVAWADFQACYLRGEHDRLLPASEAIGDPGVAVEPRFVALLDAGRLEEAADVCPHEAVCALALAAALGTGGADARAVAAEALEAAGVRGRRAAALLRAAAAPDDEALAGLDLPRDVHAALLVTLAAAHPDDAARLLAAARPRLTGARFPYPALREAAARLPGR